MIAKYLLIIGFFVGNRAHRKPVRVTRFDNDVPLEFPSHGEDGTPVSLPLSDRGLGTTWRQRLQMVPTGKAANLGSG